VCDERLPGDGMGLVLPLLGFVSFRDRRQLGRSDADVGVGDDCEQGRGDDDDVEVEHVLEHQVVPSSWNDVEDGVPLTRGLLDSTSATFTDLKITFTNHS